MISFKLANNQTITIESHADNNDYEVYRVYCDGTLLFTERKYILRIDANFVHSLKAKAELILNS